MFWQITRNLPTIFRFGLQKWKLQILQRIVQNPLNLSTPTANHTKLAQFTLISNDSLFP